MAEKINISKKETNYQGLWYDKAAHRYSSAVILGSSIGVKGNFRMIMYKNRLHKDGDSRPNYNIKFCSTDADNLNAERMEFADRIRDISDTNTLIRTIEECTGRRLFTEEEVYSIIHGMQEEYGLRYGNDLIEDYIPLEV